MGRKGKEEKINYYSFRMKLRQYINDFLTFENIMKIKFKGLTLITMNQTHASSYSFSKGKT